MHSTFVPIVTKAARSHTFTVNIPAQFYFEEVSTCWGVNKTMKKKKENYM